ncbi:MAG: TSUP family transporter [Beijerinckiaceae bacterium]
MLSLFASLSIAAASFSGAFLSGIFGMAGGQIVLAVLLYFLPVSAAMTMFSALMFSSGAWRAFLWRSHIDWSIAARYIAGSVAGMGLMLMILFVPSKPVVYLGLGLTPFIGDMLPKKWRPDITKRGMGLLCGFIAMILQIAVGGAGNVLDMFFQNSPLNRHAIVATKAFTLLFSQLMRFLYFGVAALDGGEHLPVQLFFICMLLTLAGGSAAVSLLNRLTDDSFRKWTRALIYGMSIIYVARGLWLLWTGEY